MLIPDQLPFCIQLYSDIKQLRLNLIHIFERKPRETSNILYIKEQHTVDRMAEEHWLSLYKCSGCNREYETVSQIKISQSHCCFCRNTNTPTIQVSKQVELRK